MLNLKFMMIWVQIFSYTQCAMLKIEKEDRTHQVVFKRISIYATDVQYHHIHIPVHLTNIIETATKVIETIETYIKNVHHQSLMYFKDNQKETLQINNKHGWQPNLSRTQVTSSPTHPQTNYPRSKQPSLYHFHFTYLKHLARGSTTIYFQFR
jgi:hypothetical protein